MGRGVPALLPWRLPRAAAAGSAGLMLALAGCLLQRLTGNAMASPELIGVSSGAALLLIVMSFLLPPLDRVSTMGIAAAGAFLALMAVLWVSRRSNYAADHLVLSGVALGAVIGALVSYLAALGDPRILRVMGLAVRLHLCGDAGRERHRGGLRRRRAGAAAAAGALARHIAARPGHRAGARCRRGRQPPRHDTRRRPADRSGDADRRPAELRRADGAVARAPRRHPHPARPRLCGGDRRGRPS